MLPISLLKAGINLPVLVELKNGETYNGHLAACDDWMNIFLKEVICTSRDGDKFWKMSECYIRGSIIKYLRLPDDIVDKVKESVQFVRNKTRRAGPPQGGPGNKFSKNIGRGEMVNRGRRDGSKGPQR
ncbi:RNA processing protein [Cichlidogyrus casuarinus]|uniref:U6 snRNA-associated Sm-like protein LSm4 n=1 Tax=Cichlidogyrus casuarinus TaxID=1844966 RepID=A0ABD2PSU3_9PLAT